MTRIRLTLAGVAAVALVAVAPLGAAPSATKLTATVGPGFTISLKKGTTKVTKLKPGAYTITVSDKSNMHNFHLTGPGVNKKTSVRGHGHEEVDRHAQEGHLQVRVRSARDLHEGLVQGQLAGAGAVPAVRKL